MQKDEDPIKGIESGVNKVESKPAPDAEDHLEEAATERIRAETAVLRENARDIRDSRFWRRHYSRRFYVLAIIYMLYVVALTIFQGFHIFGFSLAGIVMVALIGAPPLLGYVVKIISGAPK